MERTTNHISDDTGRIALLEVKTRIGGSEILPTNQTKITRYQYSNHLGSACLELNESAEVLSYEEYHPFGTSSYRSGSSAAEVKLRNYRYVGKEKDAESGLYYYGARYYSAWTCRFISVDKLANKYKQLTPYQNAGNNPISDYDIDGNQGKNTPEDGSKKQESGKKSNDSSKEGGKDKNSVVNGNDANEILNHHSIEHGKIELLPPEPDNPIESTPEDTFSPDNSTLQEKLPKLPLVESEVPDSIETEDPGMVDNSEMAKMEPKGFFPLNSIKKSLQPKRASKLNQKQISDKSTIGSKLNKVGGLLSNLKSVALGLAEKLIKIGPKIADATLDAVRVAGKRWGIVGVFYSGLDAINEIRENGWTFKTGLKAGLSVGLAVGALVATVFGAPVLATGLAVIGIAYAIADMTGNVDKGINMLESKIINQ